MQILLQSGASGITKQVGYYKEGQLLFQSGVGITKPAYFNYKMD